MVQVPPWGYVPEPTKRILFVSPRNVLKADDQLRGVGLRLVTGSRYFRGFIGDPVSEKELINKKVKRQTDLVEVLDRVAYQHSHKSYAGL